MDRWKDSGLTCGEFCAEIGINPRTLMYWAWRLRKDGKRQERESRPVPPKAQPKQKPAKKVAQPTSFVELVSPPATDGAAPVEIVVRSVTVRVPQTAAADLVRRAFEFAEKQK